MTRLFVVALGMTLFPFTHVARARESSPHENRPKADLLKAAPAIRRGPTQRRDLAEILGRALCESKLPDPRSLWDLGLFDAQIEARLLTAATPNTDELAATAERKSKTLARLHHLGGFASGLCPGGLQAWAVAVPASEPLPPVFSGEKLSLPSAALKARCDQFSADFAAQAGGLPRKLAINGGAIVNLKGLPEGIVSVTCQPKAPRWQGPVLWYLRPTSKRAGTSVPMLSNNSAGSLSEGLMQWMSHLRGKEGLPPLMPSADLNRYAELLAIDGSLRHNRAEQAFVAQKLRDGPVMPLGEDRVRGKDLETMAWLLWHSPRHRGLLLDKEATSIGVGLKVQGAETLAVILTGKTDQKTTVMRMQKDRIKPMK